MRLKNKKILIVVEEIYEDLELQYPKYRLLEEGAKVVVAGPKAGHTYTGKHGYPCVADVAIDQVNPKDYAALVIPGGFAPDKLRRLEKMLAITKHFHEQKKLIAFICHAGWVPISAKVLKGVTCTSTVAIKDDMINAGAKWVDRAVVKDRHFISSRFPDDLPLFCKTIIEFLSA